MRLSLAVILASCFASTLAQCSYSQLQQLSANYVASRSTGQISTLSNAVYNENFKPATLQSSILSQPLRIDNNRSLHDTTACATYTELISTNPSHPYVIGTQIRYTPDTLQATQIDTLITDAGDWLFNATGTLYWAQRENWSTIPEAKRDSRAVIKAGADAYLDLFTNKSTVVPWGTPCARLEGGSYTGKGEPSDSCNLGVPSRVVYMTNRQYVIDETVGAVDVFLNFGGCATGRPDSHEYRLEGGRLRFIHTITVMNPTCPGLPSEACLCKQP
ncbi:hypothetical protein D9611_009625 [Ephemerocybe angulata]|uniref:DUF8021 domain-containing protein n=1 Tax=Ephemerocybe angulata TaxID=980116 RepID=A0A8H5C685_9AGAR|nr:hypothetical protein D9611_009625 [Tulosesus angulatus]